MLIMHIITISISTCLLLLTCTARNVDTRSENKILRQEPERSVLDAAPLGHFPFMALLTINETGICSAVIVSEMFLLTAARCLQGDFAAVVAGRVSSTKTTTEQWRNVIHCLRYSEKANSMHDIMICRLDRVWFWTQAVKPAALYLNSLTMPKSTQECTVVAFGYGRCESPGNLCSAAREMTSWNECVDQPAEHIMCALKNPTPRSCQNDAGGAVVCKEKVFGLVRSCEDAENVVTHGADERLFTYLAHYRKWIGGHIPGISQQFNGTDDDGGDDDDDDDDDDHHHSTKWPFPDSVTLNTSVYDIGESGASDLEDDIGFVIWEPLAAAFVIAVALVTT